MAGLTGRRAAVLLAAIMAAALTARLGIWQLDRARTKTELHERIVARGAQAPLPQAEVARDEAMAQLQHYRQVQLHGRWLAERTVYLDNRAMNGRAGFIVVTPLLLGDGDALLVQRGWSPRHQTERTRLAPLDTPAGEISVNGRIAPPPSKLYAFDESGGGLIRQNLDLTDFAREIRVPLRPLSVQLTDAGATNDGLLRDWPAAALDVGKHHGYAFQWFALCALVIGLTVWFQLIAPYRSQDRDRRRRTP